MQADRKKSAQTCSNLLLLTDGVVMTEGIGLVFQQFVPGFANAGSVTLGCVIAALFFDVHAPCIKLAKMCKSHFTLKMSLCESHTLDGIAWISLAF